MPIMFQSLNFGHMFSISALILQYSVYSTVQLQMFVDVVSERERERVSESP